MTWRKGMVLDRALMKEKRRHCAAVETESSQLPLLLRAPKRLVAARGVVVQKAAD